MSSNGSNRVVIIGLDGATYRILDPMRAAGAMPNISRLRENGAWGLLRSTTPTNSAAAWVSFMTGKNPAKHGVFEFQVRSTPAGPKRVAGYHNIAGETLWDAVSREGKKVVGINVPITYPATSVNGAMVSGIPIPSGSRSWTYPEGLADEIDRETDGYVISLPWRDVQGRADPFLSRLSEMTHKRARAARYLMERYEPDLMTVVFVGPDRLQHCLWQYLDPNHPDYRDDVANSYRGAIEDYFHQLDEAVGLVLEGLSPDTTVIVMSDHGFQSAETQLSLNEWLEDHELLKFRRVGLNLFLEPLRQMDNPIVWRLRNWWHFNKPSRLRSVTPKPTVDWESTKAYASWDFQQGVSINLSDREVSGSVSPGNEYDTLRTWLKDELLALKEPATGRKVIKEVWFKEDYYNGPFMDFAADVVLVAEEGFSTSPPPRRHMQFHSTGWASGCHERDGIVIAAGGHIKGGELELHPKIEDIAPTALHMLGLAAPTDMDGSVLEEILTPEAKGKLGPPRSRPPAGRNGGAPEEADVFTDEENADLQEKLRGLGYLG